MTKQETPRPATADVAYAQARARIRGLLRRLDDKLSRHRASQRLEPKNWGYAGDLNRIADLLEQACGEGR